MDEQDSTQAERKTFGSGLRRSMSKMLPNLNRSTTSPDIELEDRTNGKTSATSSTLLPELNSTAPLPTFQRDTPQPPPRNPHRQPRPDSRTLPPIADPGFLITPRRPKVVVVGFCGGVDRPEDTPSLPQGWSETHDRAICAMERKDYFQEEMVPKIRTFFPELKGPLMVGMIDKRLRQLDQIPEIDYFKLSSEKPVREGGGSQASGERATPSKVPGHRKENLPVRGILKKRPSQLSSKE